jgi:Fe-S cluster biogenesis protein NfuA
MLAQEIKIRGEPTADPQKCRFVLDGEVLSRASLTFDNESEMDNAPLAKKLLNLPYIAQVNIAGQVVTLTGDNIESWPAVGKEIGGVIREQIKSGEAPVTEEVMDVGNRTLFDEVNELIKSDVNPSIASHGGVITLQNVSDGKAYVTMGGGCQGCSASSVTLKQGVESYLVAKVDGINEVVDMTNHSEGVNPYYTQPLPQQSTGGSCGSGCGCSSGSDSNQGSDCGC